MKGVNIKNPISSIEEWINLYSSLLDLEKQDEEAQLAEKIKNLSAKQCQEEGLSELYLEIG